MNGAATQTLEGPFGTLPCDLAPTPPRFWWLKRLLLAGVALVVLLVGLRLAWGWQVQRRIDALVARLRAEGGPVLVEDFDALRGLSDAEDNAAVFYAGAMADVQTTSPTGIELRDLRSLSLEELNDRLAEVEEFLDGNQGPLDLVERARRCQRTVWLGSLADYANDTLSFPVTIDGWKLTWVLGLAARREYVRARHDRAIERLEDILRLSEVLSRGEHPGVAMTSRTARIHASRLIEEFVPGLHPSARAAMRGLLARLLDDETPRRLEAEVSRRLRALVLAAPSIPDWSASAFRRTAPLPGQVSEHLFAPTWERERLRYVELLTSCAESAMCRDFTVSMLGLERGDRGRVPEGDTLLSASRWFRAESLLREWVRHRSFVRSLAAQNMAAVALALRLYEFDHGARPDRLELLVPDYLPSLPDDPYTTPGTPVRYIPDQPVPRLYCVGTGQTDEFGLWFGGDSPADADEVFSLCGSLPKDDETMQRVRAQTQLLVRQRRGEHGGDFPAGEDDADTDSAEQDP